MRETYGQQVARLRGERGWSQKKLSEESGVPLRTLQDVEHDARARPHRATKLAINRVLEIEGNAEETRESWPADVQAYLDMIGAWLTSLTEAERRAAMRDFTVRIMTNR